MKHLAIVLVSFVATTSGAIAGSSTSNMSVSATVTASCSISAGALAFGSYDALTGTAVDGSAQLSVACTKGATAQITLGQGAQPGAGSTDLAPARQLKSDTNYLSYSLYRDAARTLVWGNTADVAYTYVSGSNVAVDVPVYGTIGANQDVPAGTYSDSVVATVTF